MKIAIPYDKGNVFQHFGHTEFFKFYIIEENAVKKTFIDSTNGKGHSALAGFLANENVDLLICGGIGQGAIIALTNQNIKVAAGISCSCDDAVNKYLNNELVINSISNCNHHNNDHSCDCGDDCDCH